MSSSEFAKFADSLSFYNEQRTPAQNPEGSFWGSFGFGPTDPIPSPDLERQDETENSSNSIFHKGYMNAHKAAQSAMGRANQTYNDNRHLTDSTSWILFGLFLVSGILFLSMAFLFLPAVVLMPQKFALLFTFGSIFIVMSLGVIKGFVPLFKHLITRERLPFTVAYFGSLIMTLVSTLWLHSYVLTLLCAIVQVFALASMVVSYFPGGVKALSYVKDLLIKLFKSFFT
eukprot:GHVP01063615.1.p1 GENE.GHVP01063615.1~~GHVP01063615.1.p1  ORF type:complete len:239 (+),score=22.31 GHVP01063615.1:31-717(+)